MAEFPNGYFQTEVRDGHCVEAMMKCIWAAQIEVLEEIQKICQRHNLRFFADSGTLLGAVRHKGFIPWDDDMDIVMERTDYEEFLKVAKSELPQEYIIFTMDTEKEWKEPFARVVNSQGINYSQEHLKKFHGCPYSEGIDIFPLDLLAEEPEVEEVRRSVVQTLLITSTVCEQNMPELEGILSELEEMCMTKFDREGDIKWQLRKQAEILSQIYNGTDSEEMAWVAYYAQTGCRLRRSWYRECVYLPFETIKVPAPIDYHEVLTAMYGDYMTPVKDAAWHDTPCHVKQHQSLLDTLDAMIKHKYGITAEEKRDEG